MLTQTSEGEIISEVDNKDNIHLSVAEFHLYLFGVSHVCASKD